MRCDSYQPLKMDDCELCHEFKPCTNLWHDWMFVENLNDTT